MGLERGELLFFLVFTTLRLFGARVVSMCEPDCKPFLVGGLEHDFFIFPYIGNFIIPTDELHHFSGWLKPPTRSSLQDMG